jgi:hypothetical protein
VKFLSTAERTEITEKLDLISYSGAVDASAKPWCDQPIIGPFSHSAPTVSSVVILEA